jgi:hypothetical protein
MAVATTYLCYVLLQAIQDAIPSSSHRAVAGEWAVRSQVKHNPQVVMPEMMLPPVKPTPSLKVIPASS